MSWGRASQRWLTVVVMGAALSLMAALPFAARAANLTWFSPALVDNKAPFSNGRNITAASCPSANLCVALDDVGNLLRSTHPTGGASAWSVVGGFPSDNAGDLSCPSTSLCVAVDGAGT